MIKLVASGLAGVSAVTMLDNAEKVFGDKGVIFKTGMAIVKLTVFFKTMNITHEELSILEKAISTKLEDKKENEDHGTSES